MKRNRFHTVVHRLNASLIVLAFSLTQVAPAWAGPDLSRRTLRPQGAASPVTQAGLEEALVAEPIDAAALTRFPVTDLADFQNSRNPLASLPIDGLRAAPSWAVPPAEIQRLVLQLVPYAEQYSTLPGDLQNVPAFVQHIMNDLRQRQQAAAEAVPFSIPSERQVSDLLGRLERDGPTPGCACWSRAQINYFGNPERGRPEGQQTETFNAWEQLLSIGLVAEWLLNGTVQTEVNPADADVTPVISLAAVQAMANTMIGPMSVYAPWLIRQGLDVDQLGQILESGHGVIAHVGGNHVVHVKEVTATHVVYQDAIGEDLDRKTHKDFLALWSQGPLQRAILTTAAPSDPNELLPFEQARAVPCACGAYLNAVRAGGMAAALLALFKFEYRGRDNAGVLWLDENGTTRWISYGPAALRNLVRRIYSGGDVKEVWAFGAKPTTLRARRRRIMERQGLDITTLETSEYRKEGIRLERLFMLDENGAPIQVAQREALGRGDFGSMHAGAVYTIDDEMEVIDRVASDYKIVPDLVKMFIRFELEALLDRDPDHPLVRAFDRLVDRARDGALNEELANVEIAPNQFVGEETAWKKVLAVLHRKKARQRKITVPAVFNRDLVRQAFRMQAAVIGSFLHNPGWRDEVVAIFNRRIALAQKQEKLKTDQPADWFTEWKSERHANMAGQAFEAFNEWQRFKFHQMNRIHDTYWDQAYAAAYAAVDRREAEPSADTLEAYDQQDAFLGTLTGPLAELMGDVVLAHGRWGMSGGIAIEVTGPGGEVTLDPSPAHPHRDQAGVHWVAHNGQIGIPTKEAIAKEHHAEAEGISYESETGEIVKTDSKQIPIHWGYLVDAFRNYYDIWRQNPDPHALSEATGLSAETAERHHGRFQRWNQIASNLLELQEGVMHAQAIGYFEGNDAWAAVMSRLEADGLIAPWYDEIAQRLAAIEMSEGSEMGVTTYSALDPWTHRGISHERGMAIGRWNGMVVMGSDDIAALSLFPPARTVAAAQAIHEVKVRARSEIIELTDRVREEPDTSAGELSELEFFKQAYDVYTAAEVEIGQIEEPFAVEVTYLSGADNFFKVWKEIDENGNPVVQVETTTLDGRSKPIEPKQVRISPSVAHKGSFNTFTDAHFDELPWVVLKEILRYTTITTATTLDEVLPAVGADPATRDDKTAGIHWDTMEERFGGAEMPGLGRYVQAGVGSALLNVKIVHLLAEVLLPDRVDVETFDTATFADYASSGYFIATPQDLAHLNSQSGTTAPTLSAQGHFVAHGVPTIVTTANLSKELATEAIERGAGALDALGGHEISTATYMNFVAQNVVMFIYILEMARRMGVSNEVLAPYHRDLLRFPKLLREATDSKAYRAKALEVAQANQNHNKVLGIGSDYVALLRELGIKEEEMTWRPMQTMDYQDDIEPALQAAAQDGRTTVYVWATDPDRLDEAMETIRYARSLGLKPIVVTLGEENPHLEEIRDAGVFLFEVPKLTGVFQTIVDNPVILHIVRAFVQVIGRSDEEIDYLRNLAKSVVVFSFKWDEKKFNMPMGDFNDAWGDLTGSIPEDPWTAYNKWLDEPFGSATAGLEEAPQAAALVGLPELAAEVVGPTLQARPPFAPDFHDRIRGAFGPNAQRLKRIVLVTGQEPLRYAAEDARLDFPRTLGFQINQVKVVRSNYPAARRYINPEDTLVIALSQGTRNLGDRRLSLHDAILQPLDFRNENRDVEFVRALQADGVKVLTVSDASSALVELGRAGMGAILLPAELPDTAAKLAASLALDAVAIQLGRVLFEAGGEREKIDELAEGLKDLPAFLAHHTVMNLALVTEIQSAAAVVSRYDKSLWMGGGEAEAAAKEAARATRMLGEHSKAEAAHAGLHGPLANVKPGKMKFKTMPDGTVEIRPNADIDFDTVWIVLANGNEPMSSDDIRTIETRDGAIIAVFNRHLANEVPSEDTEEGARKDLGALRVIHVPDVPLMFIKHLNHMVGSMLAFEMTRHRKARVEIERKLQDPFKPYAGQLAHMASASQMLGDTPQATTHYDGATTTLLLLSGQYPGELILSEASSVLQGATKLPLVASTAVNAIAGVGNVAIIQMTGSPGVVQDLEDEIIAAIERTSLLPISSPAGPVFAIATSFNFGEVVLDNRARLEAQRALASAARPLVVSGPRGSIPLPAGIHSLEQMEPDSPERENLDNAAVYTRTVFARNVLDRTARLMRATLEGTGKKARLGRLRLSEERVAWILVGDSVKALLAGPPTEENPIGGNYGRKLELGETGSGSILVLADPEAQVWMLPWKLEAVGDDPAYAFQLVVPIPAAAQRKLGEEELRRILNPIPSLRVDETGTSELERNLEAFARANGIPNGSNGRPRLDWVRVTRLHTSPSRQRDRLFADEFDRLRTERGLIVMEPTDGTVTSGLASLAVPEEGYSAQRPLDVNWTSTWATQATMLLQSIGGGSFPEWAAGSVRYLPHSINSEVARAEATAENPIGGANNWARPAREALADWRRRLGDRLPEGADLAQGHYLTHSDFTGNTVFLFIPTTPVNVDFGNPIPGVEGIPALRLSEDDAVITYYALVGDRGNLFVEQIQATARVDELVPVFRPPAEVLLTPEAQHRAFTVQMRTWNSQWVADLDVAEINEERLEGLTTGIVELFERFREGRQAQVAVFEHPGEGVKDRSVLVALNADRRYLSDDVRQPVRELGGNLVSASDHVFRGVTVSMLQVDEVAPWQVAGLVEPLRDRLRFTAAVLHAVNDEPMAMTHPHEMDLYLRATEQLRSEGSSAVLTIRSPSMRSSQTVMAVVVPDDAAHGSVRDLIEEALQEEDSSFDAVNAVADQTAEMRILLPPTEDHPQEQPVRIFRFLLEGERKTPSLDAAEGRVQNAIRSLDTTEAGLEEAAFLTWPQEVRAADPVRALRQAINNSPFLQAVRAVNLTRGPNAWKVADRLRALRAGEITQLELQGNQADDWSKVRVASDTTAGDLRLIENNKFEGVVELGRTQAGEVTLPVSGAVRPRGIRNSTFRNARIGADVLIENVSLVQNYVVKSGTVVRDTELVKADKQTAFGLDKAYEVRNEYGKREIRVFPELRLQEAVHLSGRLGSDEKFESRYNKQHQRYVERARSDWGIVEEGAVIDGVGEVVNAYIGRGAILHRAQHVRNTVVMSGFTAEEEIELKWLASNRQRVPKLLVALTPQKIQELRDGDKTVEEYLEGERTRISDAAQVDNSVFKSGVHVASAAQVQLSFGDEHSIMEESVNVISMFVGPDSFLAKGEFGSALFEAFVVSHHKGTLNLGNYVRMGTNFGSATQTSNHDAVGPDQEALLPPGLFIGTNVIFQYPVILRGAHHSLVQTKVLMTSGQQVAFPFALVGAPDPATLQKLEPKQRLYNELVPGWVLRYLPYMLMRNEDKWQSRQKALRYRFNFEIFQPETVDLMIEARQNLEVEPPGDGTLQLFIGEFDASNNAGGIVGLGNNYLTEQNRKRGIETYTDFIGAYAVAGLYRELQRLSDAEKLTPGRVRNLIRRKSRNARWEHERQILLQEFSGRSLEEVLTSYAEQQRSLTDGVKEKLDSRAAALVRLMGPEANEILDTGERNKFVRDTLEPKTRRIETNTVALTSALSDGNANFTLPQAGLEEVTEPAVGLLQPPMMTAPTLTVTFARRETIAWTGVNLLRTDAPLRLTSTTAQVQETFGVIAGPADDLALAAGVAISRGAVNANGVPVPVYFIVEEDLQARALQKMGIDEGQILRVGPADRYQTVEVALDQATKWLIGIWQVTQVKPLGVTEPIPPQVREILYNLFGVDITDAKSVGVWQKAIDDVYRFIQA